MKKARLEALMDEAYKEVQDNPDCENRKANFNYAQSKYMELYGHSYNPARRVELDLWANGVDMPVYDDVGYNHE
ncbi:MAG: hypothetical protein R6U59_02405 [Eubacteriales bacterium]